MKAPPLVYAVGDVHGCAELLLAGLAKIKTHARGAEHTIVCLGDYVDRGPRSKQVIETLIERRTDALFVCLRGNHEQMMLEARHEDRRASQCWLGAGGLATLKSYAEGAPTRGVDAVPEGHWRWLSQRPLIWEEAKYIFVHAGINPKKPLTSQGADEFLWSRRGFLEASPFVFADARHVVHGHTMQWEGKMEPALPELLPNRTNLDTGAYKTGLLTIGLFDLEQGGGPIDLLSVF